MKILAKVLIGVFAAIGVLYSAFMVLFWAYPNGSSFSTRGGVCTHLTLSRQVSPNGELVAEHVLEECSDGLTEHTLEVGPTKFREGDKKSARILSSNRIEGMKQHSGPIYPLRIWWESNSVLHVQHQDDLELWSSPIGNVSVVSSPFSGSSPNKRSQPRPLRGPAAG